MQRWLRDEMTRLEHGLVSGRRTDRQTHGQTPGHIIYRAVYMPRAVKSLVEFTTKYYVEIRDEVMHLMYYHIV